MRQVGIIAAAALYALEHNVERLTEDHENAQILAQTLTEIPGFQIDPQNVDTNIVVFDVSASKHSVQEVVEKLSQEGVLMIPFGSHFVRAVTHVDVNRNDIDKTVQIIRKLFS